VGLVDDEHRRMRARQAPDELRVRELLRRDQKVFEIATFECF